MIRSVIGFAFGILAISVQAQNSGSLKYEGCEDLAASQFRKVPVAIGSLQEPVKMAFLPDGRIIFVERRGMVKIAKPGSTKAVEAGARHVFWERSLKNQKTEDGALGVAVDPGFASNRWIYLFYSPHGKSVNRLSRFTLAGDAIDTASEKTLLEVDVQRDYCCHTGGAMGWDDFGNLYLTTGDNSASEDAFAAINERPEMAHRDAQRSSGNTNDLRGKLIRIRPVDPPVNGKYYTIPAGNLFPPGTEKTRPEIYSMGHRNPYTLSVDKYTGWAHMAEVGPDADAYAEDKGPAQHEEFNLVKQAGNFGWPYFIGDNRAYKDWNYVANVTGPAFNPTALVNDSPNNTGLADLPDAVGAILSHEFASIGKTVDGVARFANVAGTTALTGPVYYYDGRNPNPTKLPPHFDRKWLMTDHGAGFLNIATLDAGATRITDVTRVPVPMAAGTNYFLDRPLALDVGPDGNLYAIEYAAGNFSFSASTQISRIEYIGACKPPTPVPPELPSALKAPERTTGRLLALVQGMKAIRVPASASGFSVYDLRGAKVWEFRRARTEEEELVALPQGLGRGVLKYKVHVP